jgi:hypothetical protein
MLSFQDIILRLEAYWSRHGCALLQPYDMEVGAGTSHTATFLRALGPETVIPLLPEQLDPTWWQALLERFREPGRAALIGVPLGNERDGYTNSAAGISAGTAALPGGFYRYDKHHLVLVIVLQPVRVLAVAAVLGPSARLHVGRLPRLGAEGAQ